MELTTAFALGIGAGLLISFIRERFIEKRINKKNAQLYFYGYAEAGNYIIKQQETDEEKKKIKLILEKHLNEIINNGGLN